MKNTVFYAFGLFIVALLTTQCSKDDAENEITQCVPLSFQIESEDQLEYVFVADFANIESTVYSWILDGELMEVDGVSGANTLDNRFMIELTPGKHEICILRDSECVGSSEEFCRTVTAKTSCPEMSYIQDGIFLKANFEGVNSHPSYKWTVDGEERKIDGVVVDGDNKFDLSNLEPKTYKICIITEDCDTDTWYCSDVEIGETVCPRLYFKRSENLLLADFENFENFGSYSWYVNGIEKEKDGVLNNGDHQFDLKTLDPGTYNICLQSKDCEAETIFCEDIIVESNNSDDDCPILTFKREGTMLHADFDGFDTLNSYSWYVDNVEKDLDGIANSGDYKFDLENLTPGTYSICIKSNECNESATFCNDIVINDDSGEDCPILSFTREGMILRANFDGFDTLNSYSWYVDDVEKDMDGIVNGGDYKFDLESLTPGTYNICIKSNECDPSATFCRKIIIEDNTGNECPSLSFVREGNILRANFEGFDTLSSYSWYVDNVERDMDGLNNNGDHKFSLENLNSGSYSICIKSDECPDTATFCETVTVENNIPDDCTRLSFRTEGTTAIANFAGFETRGSYDWYVNGVFQEADGTSNNGDNRFDLSSFQSGTYNVCILPSNCAPEHSFCLDIKVGNTDNAKCPKLNFAKNGDTLKAIFEGVETHELYIWVVDGEEVKDDGAAVNGNNELDISNFQKGREYKVCIYSPGCEVKNWYCRRITRN